MHTESVYFTCFPTFAKCGETCTYHIYILFQTSFWLLFICIFMNILRLPCLKKSLDFTYIHYITFPFLVTAFMLHHTHHRSFPPFRFQPPDLGVYNPKYCSKVKQYPARYHHIQINTYYTCSVYTFCKKIQKYIYFLKDLFACNLHLLPTTTL